MTMISPAHLRRLTIEQFCFSLYALESMNLLFWRKYQSVAQSLDTQIFNTRHQVMYKVLTEYHATSEIEHGWSACMVDNPLARACGLSPRTGGQTMLYLSLCYLFYLTGQSVTIHGKSAVDQI